MKNVTGRRFSRLCAVFSVRVPRYVNGSRGCPSAAYLSLAVALASCSEGKNDSDSSVGRERESQVRCDGSEGPGRGVMSSAESDELRDCDLDCDRDRDVSEAVELETGEQGLATIMSDKSTLRAKARTVGRGHTKVP